MIYTDFLRKQPKKFDFYIYLQNKQTDPFFMITIYNCEIGLLERYFPQIFFWHSKLTIQLRDINNACYSDVIYAYNYARLRIVRDLFDLNFRHFEKNILILFTILEFR